jgi:hypothetical protein
LEKRKAFFLLSHVRTPGSQHLRDSNGIQWTARLIAAHAGLSKEVGTHVSVLIAGEGETVLVLLLVAEEEKRIPNRVFVMRGKLSDVASRVRVVVITTNSSSADKCTKLPLAIQV